MDATGSYHREIMRGLGTAQGTITPLMRLQDPDLTRVIIVTLPDLTPVLEAEGLAADLRRADIAPWAWVVNQSLAAAHPTDRLLKARADAEMPHLARVRELADRVALLPMLPVEPTGEDALLALTGTADHMTAAGRALVG
jgi:arsenite-transporting ATPase